MCELHGKQWDFLCSVSCLLRRLFVCMVCYSIVIHISWVIVFHLCVYGGKVSNQPCKVIGLFPVVAFYPCNSLSSMRILVYSLLILGAMFAVVGSWISPAIGIAIGARENDLRESYSLETGNAHRKYHKPCWLYFKAIIAIDPMLFLQMWFLEL